ncbi:hypothetical protein QQX98_003251 [Neonectria punicea]|uniref:Uncharacterized protein n=1 Tax=Neonectria punicea TaxID=979145 RepID=A0ABR1HFF4_9HYPO
MLGDLMLVTPLPVTELTGILIMAIWGANAGRPPTVPPSYLEQCRLLLNFQQATLRDGMLVAEVKLFIGVHNQYATGHCLSCDSSSTYLAAWKAEWGHLLNFPTSGMLKLGYAAVELLLARRTVEARKEAVDSDLLNPVLRSDYEEVDHFPSLSEAETTLYESAQGLLRSFLSLTNIAKDEAPEFYLNCLAYSILVLSKYDSEPDDPSQVKVLTLLESLDKFYRDSGKGSSAIEFGLDRALARYRVVT